MTHPTRKTQLKPKGFLLHKGCGVFCLFAGQIWLCSYLSAGLQPVAAGTSPPPTPAPARGAAVSDIESQPVLWEAEGSTNPLLTCHTPAQPRGGPAALQVLRERFLTKPTTVTAQKREERNKHVYFYLFPFLSCRPEPQYLGTPRYFSLWVRIHF